MRVKEYIGKYRILTIALSASFLWHILWLSIIKIEVSGGPPSQVRFSKVSFLGPILNMRAMELKLQPRANSFLEKRYLRYAGGLPGERALKTAEGYARYDAPEDPFSSSDGKMTDFINDALNAPKSEPASGIYY